MPSERVLTLGIRQHHPIDKPRFSALRPTRARQHHQKAGNRSDFEMPQTVFDKPKRTHDQINRPPDANESLNAARSISNSSPQPLRIFIQIRREPSHHKQNDHYNRHPHPLHPSGVPGTA
jgi:hypothetical protein